MNYTKSAAPLFCRSGNSPGAQADSVAPGKAASSPGGVTSRAPLIIPNFIDTVRMYRREFDLSYEAAKARAIREFDKRRWPHPYQKGK